jgi:hypothetical protein
MLTSQGRSCIDQEHSLPRRTGDEAVKRQIAAIDHDAKLLRVIHYVDQSGQAAVKTRLALPISTLALGGAGRNRRDSIAQAGRNLGQSWALGEEVISMINLSSSALDGMSWGEGRDWQHGLEGLQKRSVALYCYRDDSGDRFVLFRFASSWDNFCRNNIIEYTNKWPSPPEVCHSRRYRYDHHTSSSRSSTQYQMPRPG